MGGIVRAEVELYMTDNTRCAGCGKVVAPGEKVTDVQTGAMTEKGVETAKRWGTFHSRCFERAIDSPEIAWAEIKKLTKQATALGKTRKRA